ncbi:hypothetical protein BC835DRAFT_625663 [Cytidiella melzeri]|nr:hypothetical protein BC835DRAFT_625663 [Cytidiella melzeri]
MLCGRPAIGADTMLIQMPSVASESSVGMFHRPRRAVVVQSTYDPCFAVYRNMHWWLCQVSERWALWTMARGGCCKTSRPSRGTPPEIGLEDLYGTTHRFDVFQAHRVFHCNLDAATLMFMRSHRFPRGVPSQLSTIQAKLLARYCRASTQ